MSGCAPLPSASSFIKDVPRGDSSRATPVRHATTLNVSGSTLTPCISDDALKGMVTAIRDHRLRARLDAEMDTTRYPPHHSRAQCKPNPDVLTESLTTISRRSATVVSAWRKAQDFTDGAFDWRVPQSILERVQEVAVYAATPALEVSSVAVPVLYQVCQTRATPHLSRLLRHSPWPCPTTVVPEPQCSATSGPSRRCNSPLRPAVGAASAAGGAHAPRPPVPCLQRRVCSPNAG